MGESILVTTRNALHAVPTGKKTAGLQVDRHFTTEGVHPYDALDWELRDAVITDWRTGEVAFEQRGVEFPATWSMNATTIVAQKYFRGPLGTPQRERSVRQMIDRVADTITGWGRAGGYFADDDSAEVYNAELKHLLVNQMAAFNSPVWFNVGVEEHPQCSACFILSVEDTMSSILNWYVEEGTIFKGGSGSGVNLSRIRSSREHLKGGGEASGPVSFMRGADASAGTIKCLHRDTLLVTDQGVKRIAEVTPGARVLTRFGFRHVEAVHDNGVRPLLRVRTELGDEILCTPEHRFRVRGRDGEAWREARDLRADDRVLIALGVTEHGTRQPLGGVSPGHHDEITHDLPTVLDEAFALWLGWIYGDGSITERKSTTFIALQVGDGDPELLCRYEALTRTIFGEQVHLFTERHQDKPAASVSVRFCSSQVIRFLERNGIRKGGAAELRVPAKIQSSPATVRAAFLSGLFEADGHVGNGYPTLSTISGELARDVHRLLLSIGIPSRISTIDDRRAAYGSKPVFTVRVLGGEGVQRFVKLVGFVSERKSRVLEAAVARKNASPFETTWSLPHVEAELDHVWQRGNAALKRTIAPYTRYRQARGMSLPRARTLLERHPEALAGSSLRRFAEGNDLYVKVSVEPAGQGPTFDLTVEGVHEYLVHNVVTHNSGGKTRRAAKMVILDVEHPDVEEFIWCKSREELKARALREAGFDMDLDGKDSASIQYQNANNSVRVTDDFMRAVEGGADFDLKAVTTGETLKTLKARDLFRQMAQAAWECADPGIQYDTTINDWHTTPNAGRINGSNPCCFIGDTLVETTEGPVPFDMLEKRARAGERLPQVRTFDLAMGRHTYGTITDVWVAGQTDQLVEVRTAHGLSLRCTPEHRFLTREGTYIEAQQLEIGTSLRGISGDGRDISDWVLAVVPAGSDGRLPVYDLEVRGTHNFVVHGDRTIEDGIGVVVHNSEYMHLDNSACNLASLNLRRFEADGVFDVEAFKRAVEIVFTAQEIIVGNSSYPTERIAENARAYRQLGLGYANLGSLLMSQGLAYDSEEGRAWASAITALMTGHAYRTSAEIAKVTGPFAGYARDRDGMLRVIGKHRAALDDVDTTLAPANILEAARDSWTQALDLATKHGVRNAQSTVLAPTGTIAFLMDCDTTGIEPDLGLVKSKKLVGGGSMRIVNQTVPVALKRLGYQQEQIEAIVAYIDEHSTIEGAPAFRPEHLPVFDCAMGERSISPLGHLRMMAAAQPWISGAISKCVVGDTLLVTEDGLVRIDSLHRGEAPDSFRDEVLSVASLGGPQKTDAFYFGGRRKVRRLRLRSGHTVTGTENHRVFVVGESGPRWRYLDEIEPGEYVAVQYGTDMWSALPARFDDHRRSACDGSQTRVTLPTEMTEDLAFLLGAFVAEGHITRSNWTVVITNSAPEVLARVRAAWARVFGITAKLVEQPGKCPGVIVASKTVVEFLDYLGCGRWAAAKRIPDAVLRSPRPMVLAFLQGLHLGAYASVSGAMKKLALCVDAPALLDDYQAVLTNLGVVHGRIRKHNPDDDKTYDEVYASGEQAGRLAQLVPFLEREKAASASLLPVAPSPQATADVVPGITGRQLYDLIPSGQYPDGAGTSCTSVRWRFLLDERMTHVSRGTVARVAEIEGVRLPTWVQSVLSDRLHFSPVETIEDAGERDVYDVSVPATHAFVGNGVVNHNTVNTPESATVEDIESIFLEGWKLGLKAIAIYRDNCKVAQPLSIAKKEAPAATVEEAAQQHGMIRRRLPKQRPSQTISFQVGDAEGYLTAGEYPGDGLGEIFVKLGKQGSTLSGVMDALAISVSLGLQYGVPLEAYVKKFTNMRFEPAGLTDDPEVRFASSLVDYIFRRLAIEYLPMDKRQELGIYTMEERNASLDAGYAPQSPARQQESPIADATGQTVLPVDRPIPVDDLYGDAPMCYTCGVKMIRAGSCHVCNSCGTTSGCS